MLLQICHNPVSWFLSDISAHSLQKDGELPLVMISGKGHFFIGAQPVLSHADDKACKGKREVV